MLTLNKALWAVSIGSVALATSACSEDVDSRDIRTRGVYAEFTAISDGNETEVTAKLRTGGEDSNTFLDLEGDDELFGTVGEETKELREDDSEYEASFDETEGDTKVTVDFQRGEDDTDAPDSTATLPDDFELELEFKAYNRNKPVVVTWKGSDSKAKMRWDLDSDCTFLANGRTSNDEGKITIKGDDHEQIAKDDDGEQCTATIIVDRIRTGSVDDAYKGGSFEAIQRRTITFKSVGPDEELDEEDNVRDPKEPTMEAGAPTETDSGTTDMEDAGAGENDAGHMDAAAEGDGGGDKNDAGNDTDKGDAGADAG